MKRLALLGFLTLAACGADGEPLPVDDSLTVDARSTIGVTERF
ncbi:MAG: argininosuccinate lyase [Paracoccaceae bacterium]|nr:argininosuccinate lyase [Paracoccaceae bacterium]